MLYESYHGPPYCILASVAFALQHSSSTTINIFSSTEAEQFQCHDLERGQRLQSQLHEKLLSAVWTGGGVTFKTYVRFSTVGEGG